MAEYKIQHVLSILNERGVDIPADLQENIDLVKTLSDNFTTDDEQAHELDELTKPELDKLYESLHKENMSEYNEEKEKQVQHEKFASKEEMQEINDLFDHGKPKAAKSEIGYFKGIDAEYKNRYEQNMAIEEFLNSKEEFTTDEKIFLSRFSGYGGLQNFGAKGKGIMYEYFTPDECVKKMWALAYKYGYNGGAVLEPSCGIGRFFKYAQDLSNCTGIELNEVSAKICKIIYPEAEIKTQSFEKMFIKNNLSIKGNVYNLPKYELSIGNPPYGKANSKWMGMGEDNYTHASNWTEYFIRRTLDLLIPGGLLIFIIGAEVRAGGVLFLDQQWTNCKKEIADKSELLDAYKLPSGLFEDTGVTTEIIVLRKK